MEDISMGTFIVVALVAVGASVIAMLCTNFGESFDDDNYDKFI